MSKGTVSENNFSSLNLMAAMTMVLGLQLMRAALPYFMYLLRERLGWSTVNAGIFALAVFMCAFLAGPLNNLLGTRRLLFLTGALISLCRLAAQAWTGDPLGDMILATVGTAAFIIFLTEVVGVGIRGGAAKSAELAAAFLIGMAFDLAISGAFLSYDLFWQVGIWPIFIAAFLVVLQLWALVRIYLQEPGMTAVDVKSPRSLSWAAIGPILFLELLIFSNIAWVSSNTGWSFPVSFFWLLLAHIAGISFSLLPTTGARMVLVACWILVIVTQLLLLLGVDQTWIKAIMLFSGQVALSGTMLSILILLAESEKRDGLRNLGLAGGLGMVLCVVLLFAYYAAYDLALPFSNQPLPLVAFVLIGLFGAVSLIFVWANQQVFHSSTERTRTAVIASILLGALLIAVSRTSQSATTEGGSELRVMSYNLHNGFNPRGQLDLEALAQVIEAQDPDVVGLQEVSRGWVINGSTDMLMWLANRLRMQPVFGPTADAQWGNAILSRIPIIEEANYPLPTEDLLLKRGYMFAQLPGSDGKVFNFLNTHYHNPEDGGAVRVLQSQTIINSTNEMPRTLVMGDMNAEHGTPEIDMLVEAGFSDVLESAGVNPGFTNPVPDPWRRIDYIWATADWRVQSANVPYVEASDHLPIAVTLSVGN